MSVDPGRLRQAFLDGLTDEGLEELTFRLVRPAFPQAYRTGTGADGGADVVSDPGNPPEMVWQCKNGDPDWTDCRGSLKSAMKTFGSANYTFVFPRPLKKGQLTFWRQKFVPEQLALYPTLKKLELMDNLSDLIDGKPELLNRLTQGAFGSAYSDVAAAVSRTGVNPLASIADLIGDAPELARRAVEQGRTDPRYRYEKRQREARPEDRTLKEGRIRFGFDARLEQQRSFTATIRSGDAVQEESAELREGPQLENVVFVFAETEDGAARREEVRAELAAGRPVDLICDEHVGISAGPLPDRFEMLADADGIMRRGTAHLELSEPLTLKIELELKTGETRSDVLSLYLVPPDTGFKFGYGGSLHGALVYLDINPDADDDDPDAGPWVETAFAVGIDTSTPPSELLNGLKFIAALGVSRAIRLECDGVFPDGGFDLDITESGLDPANSEILKHAWVVASVLAALTELDGRERWLGSGVHEYDLAIAGLVGSLLGSGELRQPLTEPYPYRVGSEFADRDPQDLLRGIQRPLAPLCGQPTVVAQMRFEGDVDGRLAEIDDVLVFEATPRTGGRAEVVVTLIGPIPPGPEETEPQQ